MHKQLSEKAKEQINQLIKYNVEKLTEICEQNDLSIYNIEWNKKDQRIEFFFLDNKDQYAAGEISLEK